MCVYRLQNLIKMGSLVVRLISQKGAAGYPLRCISPMKAAAGVFSSSRSPNCSGGGKLCCRMMSTMRSVNSDESSSSSSTLPSRTSPWLMLPPTFGGGGGDNNMVYNFYSLAESKVLSFNKRGGGGGGEESPDDDALLVGSSHGWLALFNERNCDLFLSNPILGRHVKLPPIHTLPIPQVNLTGGFGCVKKVIISCSPDDHNDDCRAIMSYGPEERLAFCCPGHSTEWTPIGEFYHHDETRKVSRVYQDFVYSSRAKLLFCITQFADMEGWDLRDPQSPKIDWKDGDEDDNDDGICYKELCWRQKYLVFAEQSNQLFLVTRHIMERMAPDGSYVKSIYYGNRKGWDDSYPYKTIGFDVYKIEMDREGQKLRYKKGSLDEGIVMFIGINHAFAMSAAEFPELKPNSIYFTDAKELTPPRWISRKYSYGGHDIGIFDYENKTFSSCYYPCDVQSITRIVPAPMWFTPSCP